MIPDTSLRMTGVHLPLGSFLGIGSHLEEIDEVTLERDLCGAGVPLGPLWGPKYRVSLQASGVAIRWAPAFMKLRKCVDVVTLSCISRLTDEIPAGASSTVLVRPPVAGSVIVHSVDDERARIPFTVNGSTVTLAAGVPLVGYTVKFRPILMAVLTQRSSDTPELSGNMSWSAVFEEV